MTDYLSQSVFQPSIPKQLITDEDRRFFEAFSISMDPDGDDKVYLYAEDWCTAGVLAGEEPKDDIDLCEDDLFARFQEIIRRSNGELPWILKESSYSCSRMRPDGFGGSAVFITADDVQFCSTSSWLEQRIHETETGDIGPETDSPIEKAVKCVGCGSMIDKSTARIFYQSDDFAHFIGECCRDERQRA